MDAHSRDMNVLHKCNRARRENVASDILSCVIRYFFVNENPCYYPIKLKNQTVQVLK